MNYKKMIHPTTVVDSQYFNFDTGGSYKIVPLQDVLEYMFSTENEFMDVYDRINYAKELILSGEVEYDDIAYYDDDNDETTAVSFNESIRRDKNKLPKIHPGCVFEGKGMYATIDNFKYNSGIILLDIDADDNENLDEKMAKASLNKYSICTFKSASGTGYKLLVYCSPTETWEDYKELAIKICCYYSVMFRIKIDKNSYKPSCGTYFCYDPEPVWNHDVCMFTPNLIDEETLFTYGFKKRPSKRKNFDDFDPTFLSDDLLSDIFREISARGLVDKEPKWAECGWMIYNIFGSTQGHYYWEMLRDPGTCTVNASDSKWNSIVRNSSTIPSPMGMFMKWVNLLNNDDLKDRIKKEKKAYFKTKGE